MPILAGERLFQMADAIALAGLSRSQLREWCGRDRRALIEPDVAPQGTGRVALYGWRTLLVLRILHHLQECYGIEVGRWTTAAKMLRTDLEPISFPAAWSRTAHFKGRDNCFLVLEAEALAAPEGLLVRLEPHLVPLAEAMALPRPDQLHLFPLTAVGR